MFSRKKTIPESRQAKTAREFWMAVMIVTNHAYFNCREDYECDPWKFPGMPSFREAVDLVTEQVNHAILHGWLDNDVQPR